jgi:predicted dehydrogenase
MNPILIVGSGKAALLHLRAYLRLWPPAGRPRLYVVPGAAIDPGIAELSRADPRAVEFLDRDAAQTLARARTVVDICTPTITHRRVAEQMAGVGFARFLVEKPLATSACDVAWMDSLRVRLAVMQNYLFSRATQAALCHIRGAGLSPRWMVSLFSKDRVPDSLQGRGFEGGQAPHALTVELPHQLYLARRFLGPGEVRFATAWDMDAGGMMFPDHGSGVVALVHPGQRAPVSLHFSHLAATAPIRLVAIACDGGEAVLIRYPTSGESLTSTVETFGADGRRRVEVLANDDMLKAALAHYYAYLTSDSTRDSGTRSVAVRDARLLAAALARSGRRAGPRPRG